MKKNYKGNNQLHVAVNDYGNVVTKNKENALKVITNEFVKLNEKYTPEDTRHLIKTIKLNTQYSKGLIVASTSYATKVYYTKMNFKKSSARNRFFEYTWEKNKNTFKEQYIAYIKKQY